MKTFDEFLNEQLQDVNFKKEWYESEPEYELMRLIAKARNEKGITQKELSELTGISQADISRLEHGEANPSLKTIQRLAVALDKTVQIAFI